MGFHEPHSSLLILLSTLMGLGSYGLIIRFLRGFLALGPRADDRPWPPPGEPKTLLLNREPNFQIIHTEIYHLKLPVP
jgi:hypothetical protein